MIWFTSDLHWCHKNICKLTNRQYVTTPEEHDEWLIDLWNSQVHKGDTIYHCGDFCFSSKFETVSRIVNRLNGQKIFIKGNHDNRDVFDKLKLHALIANWHDYKEIKLEDKSVCLFHFPISVWHKQHHGSLMLHGHCLHPDMELLTEYGFKKRDEIQISDKIATRNMETGALEYNSIKEKYEYSGEYTMYEYNGKSIAFSLTDQHRYIYKQKEKTTIDAICKVKGNHYVPLNAVNTKTDYPISDDMLRLYIQICTDGSFENSSLVRFHLKKQRKIQALTNLLSRLGIKYSHNIQKTGNSKINFTRPLEFSSFNVKPLDRKLIMNLSQRQVDILVETYEKTDGCKTGKNSWQFSTAKESEANLLQEILVTSGYCCNLLKRVRGKYVGFVLSVNSRKEIMVNSYNFKKVPYDGDVWCVSVDNGTLLTRYKGKVHVTGNSHGSFQGEGKIMDVGLDAAYNYFGKHCFFSEKDVLEYMQSKEIVVKDHHKGE